MEDKEVFLKCSYYNCKKTFAIEYYSSGLIAPPINDNGDKFHQICEGLLITRLFCGQCCTKHASIICLNSKIPIEE